MEQGRDATLVFLPGEWIEEPLGRRTWSAMSPWGCKEVDTMATNRHTYIVNLKIR